MKVVISGSRSIHDAAHLEQAIIQSGFGYIDEIVYGKAASGVDRHAEDYARAQDIKATPFPAQWHDFTLRRVMSKKNGRGQYYNAVAGMVRNEDMVLYVRKFDGGLIAVWNFESPGTANTIAHGIVNGLKVFVYDVRKCKGAVVRITPETMEWAEKVIKHGFKRKRNS